MLYNTSHVVVIDSNSQPEVDTRNNDVYITWEDSKDSVTISGDKKLLIKMLTTIINDIILPLPDNVDNMIDRDEFWDDEF